MDNSSVPDIHAYLDYRAYLRDHYQARKERDAFFSYRHMAQKTGVDAGWIAKVLAGSEHLSQRSLDSFAKLCRLSVREGEYFAALVGLAKAKGTRERAEAFERAMALKAPGRTTLGERQLAYYSRWWHAPVRSLLGMLGKRATAARIAKSLRPEVPLSEVESSIALLKDLGLVRRTAQGWEPSDAFVSNPPEGAKAAVRGYQADTLDLAKAALERHSPEHRDISTLTLSFDSRDLPLVRERLAAVRDSLIQLSAEAQRPDAVYQVNMQVFPVTSRLEGAA
jgi:uncharacterized protein (TIGR02147 family)